MECLSDVEPMKGPRLDAARRASIKARSELVDAFAGNVRPIIKEIQVSGVTRACTHKFTLVRLEITRRYPCLKTNVPDRSFPQPHANSHANPPPTARGKNRWKLIQPLGPRGV